MRLLLHSNQLGERGTETSIFFLGKALKSLGHTVAINYCNQSAWNKKEVIDYFSKEFELLSYSEFNPEDKEINSRFDYAYFLKSGENDGKTYRSIFSGIHVVFSVYEPHGQTYTYISKDLANATKLRYYSLENGGNAVNRGCFNALDFEAVPHIVEMPNHVISRRSDYGIPEDAFVITRMGGKDTFDIPWVKEELLDFIESNKDVFFVAINTAKFANHPRIRYLDMVINLEEKASLLSMADLFLHARLQGESFGMAIVESLQMGTPVVAWEGGTDQNHTYHLSRFATLYSDKKSLRTLLLKFLNQRSKQQEVYKKYGDTFRASKIINQYMEVIWRV